MDGGRNEFKLNLTSKRSLWWGFLRNNYISKSSKSNSNGPLPFMFFAIYIFEIWNENCNSMSIFIIIEILFLIMNILCLCYMFKSSMSKSLIIVVDILNWFKHAHKFIILVYSLTTTSQYSKFKSIRLLPKNIWYHISSLKWQLWNKLDLDSFLFVWCF